jgi:hypothetical protein
VLHSVGEYAHDVAPLMLRSFAPSILTSVPDHLPNRTRSPFFEPLARILPSSPRAPGPTAVTSPSCGLSAVVSGMMMPPAVLVRCRPVATRHDRGGDEISWCYLQGDLTPVSETSRLRTGCIRPQVSTSDRDLAAFPILPQSSRRKVRRMKPPSFRQNRPAIGKLRMAVPEGIVTDFWEMN